MDFKGLGAWSICQLWSCCWQGSRRGRRQRRQSLLCAPGGCSPDFNQLQNYCLAGQIHALVKLLIFRRGSGDPLQCTGDVKCMRMLGVEGPVQCHPFPRDLMLSQQKADYNSSSQGTPPPEIDGLHQLIIIDETTCSDHFCRCGAPPFFRAASLSKVLRATSAAPGPNHFCSKRIELALTFCSSHKSEFFCTTVKRKLEEGG